MKTLIYLYKYFYKLAGGKFIFLGLLMILGIVLEAFGASIILPFLQGIDDIIQ